MKHHIFCLFLLFAPFSLLSVQAQDKGLASYYGSKFHSRYMAGGKRYHRDSLFCAHRTYPFGTKLLVRNPANDAEVVVTVEDRGPFGRGRIVDLSYAAAREIGIIAQGLAPVEVSI